MWFSRTYGEAYSAGALHGHPQKRDAAAWLYASPDLPFVWGGIDPVLSET